MVCSNCGTLNPTDGEVCGRCGRPLAAIPDDMCFVHADRPAIARCSRCDAALCAECDTVVGGSPYCPDHAAALDSPGAATLLREAPVVDVGARDTASFAQRLQAGLIDLSLVFVYVFILYLLLWALIGSPPNSVDAGGWRFLFWLFATLGPLGYLVVENASGGRTVGKGATDLIALREDGTLMDFDTAVLRAVLSIVSFLLGGLGFWAILWNRDRRALHDRWTHTIVVCA